MVSVVLHNACLRMEEEGADLDEILAPKGIQRWLGKGGLAIGGAASLLVGAVFGGILESVPVLLPPPAAAAATPSIVNGLPVSSVLTQVADAAPAPVAPVVAAAASAASNGGNLVSVPTPKLPGGGSGGGSTTTNNNNNGGGGGGNNGCTSDCGGGQQQQQQPPTLSQTLTGTVDSVVAALPAPLASAAAPVQTLVDSTLKSAPLLSTTPTPSSGNSGTGGSTGGTITIAGISLP